MEREPERVPAEAFPPGEFIEGEMNARGWTAEDVANRMGDDGSPKQRSVNLLLVHMLIEVRDTGLILDQESAAKFGLAFGVSPQFFLNLDAMWRKFGPPSRHATAH